MASSGHLSLTARPQRKRAGGSLTPLAYREVGAGATGVKRAVGAAARRRRLRLLRLEILAHAVDRPHDRGDDDEDHDGEEPLEQAQAKELQAHHVSFEKGCRVE